MGDIFSLISVAITSIVGPLIVIKQKASEKKAAQSADVHLTTSNALVSLATAIEGLHTKMDCIISRPCDGSANVISALGETLHQIQRDVDVIRDRGAR